MQLPDTTFKTIIAALTMDGINVPKLAKEIDGINEKSLRAALKAAGYAPVPGNKGWHYVGDGEEPLDSNVFDYVKRSSPRVHKGSEQRVKRNSPVVHTEFTPNEISMLKEMLWEWQQHKQNSIDKKPDTLALHDRIKDILADDKVRKTIVINKLIGERLDTFSEIQKINKSDIIYLALTDFFEKYESQNNQ